MTADAPPIVLIGVHHHSCPDALREQLFVDDAETAAALGRLRERGAAEAMILSTCDRVAVAGVFVDDSGSDLDAVAAALGEPVGLTRADLAPYLVRQEGADAVRQLFRIASGLDSQIIGEPQILGQIKAAQQLARDHGALGPALDRVLQATSAAARRVRSETRIGEGAVSLASAAVARVRDLHGDLGRRSGLLVGTGELGLLVARHLVDNGLSDLTVLDRFKRRAAAAAADLDAHHGPLESLGAQLDRADVVVATIGEGHYLITADAMHEVLRRRRQRPVFLLDLAVPADVEPAVHRLDAAFVYDTADLERLSHQGRAERMSEAAKGEAIVAEALSAFVRDGAGRTAVPDLTRLRAHVHTQVRAALGDGPDADMLARRIAGRLLHGPSETLRRWAEEGSLDSGRRALIAELFGLPADGEGDQR